jgi:hypothetical protein
LTTVTSSSSIAVAADTTASVNHLVLTGVPALIGR